MATGEMQQADENRKRNRGSLQLEHSGGYTSPRPGVRTGGSSQALENLIRARGTLGGLLEQKQNAGYSSPRPKMRVPSAEGKDLAEKGQGQQMGPVLDVDGNRFYYSAREARVPSPRGKENLRRSWGGDMGSLLQTEANRGYSSPRPAPRGPPGTGRDIANRGQRGSVTTLLGGGRDGGTAAAAATPRPAPRQPTPDAEANATKGRGSMARTLNETAGSATARPPRKDARVTGDGEGNAAAGRGTLGLVLAGTACVSGPPAPRVRPEAQETAMKNAGSLSQMYSNFGRHPASARPPPKVKDEATDIYNRGTKGVIQNLLARYGTLPRSPRPAARVKPEAARFASTNKGQMGDLMHGPKQTYKKARPGSGMW